MRHRVKINKLGRTASHRNALLNALVTSLFRHKKIKTTVAKAKEARMFAEKLITKAKVDTVHSRRIVARFIKDKTIVQELFGEINTTIGDRPGGYTRIVKLGNRPGDAAEMAILELVDYNTVVKKDTKKKQASTPKPAKVKEKTAASETKVEEVKVAPAEEVKEDMVQDAEVIKPEAEESKPEEKK